MLKASANLCLVALLGTGCASSAILKEIEPEGQPLPETAIVFEYALNIRDSRSGSQEPACELRVQRMGDEDSVAIRLRQTKPRIILRAPEGQYRPTRLSCGQDTNWDLTQVFSYPIIVTSGHINYVGEIKFTSLGQAASETPETPSDLKAELPGSAESAAAFFNALAEPDQKRVVSAFTQKSITRETVLRTGKKRIWFDFRQPKSAGRRARSKLPSLHPDFSKCVESEDLVNPVPLGRLSYRALYDGGQCRDLTTVENTSTFSDDFLTCTDQAIREFQSSYHDPLEYEFSFGI